MANELNSTFLSNADIVAAKQVVENYRTTAIGLFNQLQQIVVSLGTQQQFVGDAYQGFLALFNTTFKTRLETDLTERSNKDAVLVRIENLLDEIKSQLLDTIDPKLGEINENAGNGSQGNVSETSVE